MKSRKKVLFAAVFASVMLAGCGGSEAANDGSGDSGEPDESGSGAVEVRANGEDFVRQGFETKDGWDVSFDHVFVTLSDVTAYQSDPAYNPDDGESEVEASEEAALEGVHTVDLAEGGADADTIEVGAAEGAPEGIYNALSWRMVPAEEGPAEGSSVLMIGTAEKDGEAVEFEIPINEEYQYSCGEFVGDERKGVLADGGVADLEATFHFDHIFGDGEAPPDDDINTGAVGFDPFAEMAEGGSLEANPDEIEAGFSTEDFELLQSELPTLGHTGEGHCLEANSGATG